MSKNPWSSGPAEILKHAFDLLKADSDTNRRLAMILVDNAVEQTLKTYLSLPKRVSGFSLGRKRLEEIFESFPALLDAIEETASDKIVGLDLGAIEWYHRMRNQLYHQGFGLTVERNKVEVYAELSRILINNLLGENLHSTTVTKHAELGKFVELWNRLEFAVISLSGTHSLTGPPRRNFLEAARFLRDSSVIPQEDFDNMKMLRALRNELLHGQKSARDTLKETDMKMLEDLTTAYESVEGIEEPK